MNFAYMDERENKRWVAAQLFMVCAASSLFLSGCGSGDFPTTAGAATPVSGADESASGAPSSTATTSRGSAADSHLDKTPPRQNPGAGPRQERMELQLHGVPQAFPGQVAL